MTSKVTGVASTLRSAKIEFDKEATRAAKRVKRNLFNNIVDATPVDTGKARDGWYETSSSIKNDVEYVLPLNNGTSEREPRRFIERAVLQTKNVKVKGSIVT